MIPAAEITDREEYAHLLGDTLPHVIHTEAENVRSTAVLEGLLRKKGRTAEEKRLAELLTLLIEEYEERRYALPQPAGPVERSSSPDGFQRPSPGGSAGRLWHCQRSF